MDRAQQRVGGLTSPELSGQQASIWWFIDQVMVKYGPIGLMLIAASWYIVTKDKVIDKKDELFVRQQDAFVELAKSSTQALVESTAAQKEFTYAIQKLTNVLEEKKQ